MDPHFLPRRYPGINETLGVGTAVGDAMTAIGRGGVTVGTTLASAGWSLGTKVAGIGYDVASATVPKALRYTGEATRSIASFMIKGYENKELGLRLGSPLKVAAKAIGKVGKNMVEYKGSHLEYNRYLGKLEKKGPSMNVTKFGLGVLTGLSAIQGARGAVNAYMGSRMGTVDTRTTSLTPDYSPQEYKIQHPDFAGATGDLVFALDANRHG